MLTGRCGSAQAAVPRCRAKTTMHEEGGESLEVIHHIWVDSKAPWEQIGDSGRQHREAFEG